MNKKNKLIFTAIFTFFSLIININAASLSTTKYSEMKYKYKTAESLTKTITRTVKYDRYKGGFTTTFCIAGNTKCVVKTGKIDFPATLKINSVEYQGDELSEKLGSTIVPAEAETNVVAFKPYYCEYSLDNNILKLKFDVDGSSDIYFNNSNITGQLTNSFNANSVVFSTNNVTKLDNASDYDSASGNCPAYAYYRPSSSIKLGGQSINVTYALFTNTTNGATYTGFSKLDFNSEKTILMSLSKTNSSSNTNGNPIIDTTGCGIFGNLLSSNGFVSRIIGLVNVFLVAGVIVLGMLDFFKVASSNDEKATYSKALKKTITRIIIAIIIILLPTLIDFFVRVFFSDFTKSCLNNL